MSRKIRVAQVIALVTVLLALAFCGWWRVSGGRWERVETPSMGTTAPVGTLVWVEPLHGHVRAGEIVTFRAPDGSGRVFTHRVSAVRPDGSFSTGGDLSGPDQWLVPPGNAVGHARWLWPGAGWLVRAAPVLLFGAVLTWGLTLLRRRERLPLALVGAALTMSAALVVYQPLTAAEQLGTRPVAHGAQASYVGTGLLPVRLTAAGARSVNLASGESGTIDLTRPDAGRFVVHIVPVVPWWLWVVIIALCFVPAVLTLTTRRATSRSDRQAPRTTPTAAVT